MKLLYKGKAELVKSSGNPIFTDKKIYDRPTVIRLKNYVNKPYKKIPLTRQNIFKRDGFSCGYCSSTRNLTLDHVIPKSKGGGNSWENLVTCCRSCNIKKEDKKPEEVGLKLNYKLTTPNGITLLLKTHKVNEDWQPYIFY